MGIGLVPYTLGQIFYFKHGLMDKAQRANYYEYTKVRIPWFLFSVDHLVLQTENNNQTNKALAILRWEGCEVPTKSMVYDIPLNA